MQIFVVDSNDLNACTLNEQESKHCVKVLRKKNGDTLHLTDGKGHLYTAEITDAHPKNCVFRITNQEHKPSIAPPITIAIAPTKNMDRIEFFVEKATEIGVQRIIPLLTSNSERKVFKGERVEKIIVSACKQSMQFEFPVLDELTPFKNLIDSIQTPIKLIAHCEEGAEKNHLKNIPFNAPATILIGPEGDFSSEEIKLALNKGFQPISLGDARLRTETAGIVACTILNTTYEI